MPPSEAARADTLIPVERDGWVQHGTYGHNPSQMKACGKCMDAMIAMRDALARRLAAPDPRPGDGVD